jgi:hypothetical protein
MQSLYQVISDFGNFLEAHNGAISAISAAFVAAFTFTLWRSTVKLWRTSREQSIHIERSAKASNVAADAAGQSARVAQDALLKLERPFLLPSLQVFGFEARRDERSRTFIRFELSNFGRTPAIVTHRVVGWVHSDGPPELPPLRDEDRIPQMVLPPNDRYAGEHTALAEITYRDIPGVKSEYTDTVVLQPAYPDGRDIFFLYVFGYEDIFGNMHETARCWKYEIFVFRPFGGDKYNYTT